VGTTRPSEEGDGGWRLALTLKGGAGSSIRIGSEPWWSCSTW
jgi:hypothetical protein